MRTLEEVIDSITKQSGLEIRDVRKPEKDRFWVDRETYNDALHYLREYRSDMKQWESDRKGYEDWIKRYKDARDKHQQAVIELKRNDPLTWDELCRIDMIGEPVWNWGSRRWMLLIDSANDNTWIELVNHAGGREHWIEHDLRLALLYRKPVVS